MSQRVDILVAGAGIAGCCAAALLAKQGFEVALLDAGKLPAWSGHQLDQRVSAINLASEKVLTHLRAWPTLSERGISPMRSMSVWQQNRSSGIDFSASQIGQAHLGHIIANDLITSTLSEMLKLSFNVNVVTEQTISSLDYTDDNDTVVVTSDSGATYEAGLLIAADGAHSSIRRLCGISQSHGDYAQRAVVATLQAEFAHQATAYQCFLDNGPVALLPLNDNRVSLVWSLDEAQVDATLCASDFAARVSAAVDQRLGKLTLLNEPRSFPLQYQHASQYIGKRVALLGDAAHQVHPLAGIGANLGILDAAVLAQVLTAAKEQQHDPASHHVLRRYERWRRPHNGLANAVTQGFQGLFNERNAMVAGVLGRGLELANGLSPIKHRVMRHAVGIAGDLPAICR